VRLRGILAHFPVRPGCALCITIAVNTPQSSVFACAARKCLWCPSHCIAPLHTPGRAVCSSFKYCSRCPIVSIALVGTASLDLAVASESRYVSAFVCMSITTGTQKLAIVCHLGPAPRSASCPLGPWVSPRSLVVASLPVQIFCACVVCSRS
jgi:hypothetical protein